MTVGLAQTVIDTLKTKGISNGTFPEPYHVAAEILNPTLIWKNIPTEIQDKAINTYGIYGFIEIVVLSGFYQMFSAINQGFDVLK